MKYASGTHLTAANHRLCNTVGMSSHVQPEGNTSGMGSHSVIAPRFGSLKYLKSVAREEIEERVGR